MHFVKQMEQFCRNHARLEAFRSHPSFQQFIKKWNLPVYFQLRCEAFRSGMLMLLTHAEDSRFQEIAARFEASLVAPPQSAEVIDFSQGKAY